MSSSLIILNYVEHDIPDIRKITQWKVVFEMTGSLTQESFFPGTE
jgi:hypothetical protein